MTRSWSDGRVGTMKNLLDRTGGEVYGAKSPSNLTKMLRCVIGTFTQRGKERKEGKEKKEKKRRRTPLVL